ncbi:MAG: branched-chain amino acid transport system permease protein livM [Frankiaceae bacterium]|jgi:branched-chain amino acid transport system permease protein|nr:branched-chain amino acid transport system permease protein livM [Frankiaceae bacterium]
MTGYGATWRESGLGDACRRALDMLSNPKFGAVIIRRIIIGLAFYVVVRWYFGLTTKNTVDGLALGSLYGIVAVALVLAYRTSRIINFAAAAVGAVPAITAVLLSTAYGVNYLLTMPIALIGGVLSGAFTEIVILRRFNNASRLIVTVISIGVAQSYAALGFFIPVWFGERAAAVPKVTTPWQDWQWHNSRGEPVITGNQVFAFLVVLVLTLSLMFFLRRTRLGIALRASSENVERAKLLGIPVNLVNVAAWSIAGLMSGAAIFAQAPLIGVPGDASLGFDTLLYGLAAAVIARFEKVGLALLGGLGVGLLITGSIQKSGTNDYAAMLMFVLIYLAMLLQRRSRSRAVESDASSWQTVANFRPIPVELRRVDAVVRARALSIVGALGLAILLPYVIGEAYVPTLQILPIYGIVGVSLVVLTGWAGQISLGQFGIVGMSAACAGGLVASHNIDFFAALAIGIGAGILTALIVGLPATRIHGLYLAVTTLAFGYAVQYWFLNPNYVVGKHILPNSGAAAIRRPWLYGRINLEDEKNFYFLCVVMLLLCILAAQAFRKNRSGRVLIALRDNQRAATSYTIAPVRTRLAAFAISGAICGVAGVLYSYQQHNVIPSNYDVFSSIGVFLAAAVAGLGSLSAGVFGVISFEAFVLFGPHVYAPLGPTWFSVIPLLLTGPLLIVNLYANPGGLAGWAFEMRDDWLRRVAAKRRIHVPALIADRMVEAGPAATPAEPAPMPEPELVS